MSEHSESPPHTRDEAGPARGFIGVLVPNETVDVAARTEGILIEVAVRLGDTVVEGDVLARIEDRYWRDELAMAQATLGATLAEKGRAKLELDEASERLERWEKLDEDSDGSKIVSREKLEELRYQAKFAAQRLEEAEARVAQSTAKVGNLKRRISDAVIQAPFDGVVAQRYLDPGTSVSPGVPIVRIVRGGEPWVRFAVPNEDAHRVRRGDPVTVRLEGVEPAIPGTIAKVAPEIHAASQMVFVEARLGLSDDGKEPLSFGQVARVHLDERASTSSP